MTVTVPQPDFSEIAARFPKGGNIVIHSDFAEPAYLAQQLTDHADLFADANLHTLMPMGNPVYAVPDIARKLHIHSFFPGAGLRKAVNDGLVETRRCVISDIAAFFESGDIKADLLLLQVSRPNDKGEVSLGISVDYMPAVLAQNPIVVAQINPQMPFTCGPSTLPLSAIDYAVEVDEAILEFPSVQADDVDSAIARHVASLVEDGDVVQAGIGALPDAVIANLGHLKHLGAHTGILTSAWLPLIDSGVVDNSLKKQFTGKTVTTMAGGDRHFYQYLDNNRDIEFHPCSLTHSYELLSTIDRLCAINSVLQVDLAGRANAESVNGRRISSPGGLPDFVRGATAASNGKSIIALRSSFKGGKYSNIIAALDKSAPVTIDGSLISHVVTEYGVATLDSPEPQARAKALIAVAHPNHRELLEQQFQEAIKN